jgi:hypothetical protein
MVYGAKLVSNVASAEYIYADAEGVLTAGTFNASGDDMVISDALGSVTYSLKFPISGSGAAATLVGTNYMSDDLSVFEALRSLDTSLKTVADSVTAGGSDKGWGILTADIASGDVFGHASITAGSTDMDTVMTSLKDNGGEELIYVNGQLLTPTADYTFTAATPALSFTFGLKADDVIMVVKV